MRTTSVRGANQSSRTRRAGPIGGTGSTYSLACKNEMNSTAGGRIPSLNQYIDPGYVPVFETERLDRSYDCGQVLTANCDIDIACQSPGVGLSFFHVKVNGQPTDDAIFQASGREGAFYPICKVKQPLQTFLEKDIDSGWHPFQFLRR